MNLEATKMTLSDLLYKLYDNSDNVKHYRGDLLLDAAHIAAITKEDAYILWITRECGTHIFDIDSAIPDENDQLIEAVRRTWASRREYVIHKNGNEYEMKLIADNT